MAELGAAGWRRSTPLRIAGGVGQESRRQGWPEVDRSMPEMRTRHVPATAIRRVGEGGTSRLRRTLGVASGTITNAGPSLHLFYSTQFPKPTPKKSDDRRCDVRCTHWSPRGRCEDPALYWLIEPEGRRNPGGYVCRVHAQATIDEYEIKLGETWTAEPVDELGHQVPGDVLVPNP